MCRVGPERKTLGSGLNAGNIGAEIDVIKPALPAQRSDCDSLRGEDPTRQGFSENHPYDAGLFGSNEIGSLIDLP